MLPTAPHSIRRQVLEVELEGSEADALALQRTLPGLSARLLAPMIAEVLDRCAPAADWICIERLEVDAGSIALERLEHDLPAALRQALEAALMAQVSAGSAAAGAAAGWRRSTAAQSLDEALAYFLEYGNLPSACHLAPGMNFEQTLLAGWQAAVSAGAGGTAACAAVLTRALAGERARERLTAQFSALFLRVLLARMTRHSAQVVATILPAGAGAGLAPDAARRLELRRWQAVFARAAGGTTAPLSELTQAAMVKPAPAGAPAPVLPAAPLARRGAGQAARARRERAHASAAARKEHGAGAPHPDAEQGIFINNAGLVLLHPFLGRLFEALAVSAGERLLQPDRALRLLHYLASGSATAPEYELVLPKLLCNLPLTQPVAPDIVPGEEERAECEALLAAVIGHWDALRSTGADGLRAAFLLRPGKLSRRDGAWLLQVEPDTADILLNQLPWGISPVKLAWMDQLMWVEWG